MDYEKAYKEALERAKAYHSDLTRLHHPREVVEDIFPELVESEDEMMRNLIIAVVMTDKKLTSDQKKRMKAYLEKQKEQKSADIPSSGSGAMGTNPPAYKLYVKPAEWSDEDIDMLDLLRAYLNGDAQLSISMKQSLIIFLNSLIPQPHWKPSEEQMKALGIAIRCGIQLGTWEEVALRSLNDDLKKLVKQ